jgi:hypothetical protein
MYAARKQISPTQRQLQQNDEINSPARNGSLDYELTAQVCKMSARMGGRIFSGRPTARFRKIQTYVYSIPLSVYVDYQNRDKAGLYLIRPNDKYDNRIAYYSDAQPVCRRGHPGVPRNFHLSL